MYSSQTIMQGDVLAFQFPMDHQPIRLGVAAMAPFAPRDGVKRRLQIGVAQALRQRPDQPGPSKRFNVSRTVDGAMPRRRAISRVSTPAENFKRMISRAWRIALFPLASVAPLGCQRSDPKQASGGARRPSNPGRDHSVPVGGIIS